MLAHGLQVFIQTAAGAGNFPQQTADSLVALLSFSGEMHHPLYAGDTAYPGLEIIKLTPQRTTGIIEMRAIVLNQHDQLVMRGTQLYQLKKSSRLMINHFKGSLRQVPLAGESRKAKPNRHAKKGMHHQGQSANQWRV